MEQSKKVELEKLLKALVNEGSCYKDLKEVATKVLNSFDDSLIVELKKELEDAVTPIDKSIEFIASDMGKQIFGDKRDAVLADAKKRQAAGEKICTCGACQIGAKILKLL